MIDMDMRYIHGLRLHHGDTVTRVVLPGPRTKEPNSTLT